MAYTLTNADTDLENLRELMKDRSGPYWKGPSAERMQRGYTEILKFVAGGPPPTLPTETELGLEKYRSALRNPADRKHYFADESHQAAFRSFIDDQEKSK